jgi:hypothetical protein
VSITPADDFRAVELLKLLERVGRSLDTLLLRFQVDHENGRPVVPAIYQLAQVSSGMYLPSRSDSSEPQSALLPNLARLRILCQGSTPQCTIAGNLPSLLEHSSPLLEIDLSGAPMDLRTFMSAAEQLVSHAKTLEVLHLNVHQPRPASTGSRDLINNRLIFIALDWLLDRCGLCHHLRSFSITSFGGVEIVTEKEWVSLTTFAVASVSDLHADGFKRCLPKTSIARRIRSNFPLLRSLSLPVVPTSSGTTDTASLCAEAVALLTSESPWQRKESLGLLKDTSALVDLQTVTLKVSCGVERVADINLDMGPIPGVDGRRGWEQLPLTEFGETWQGSIVRGLEAGVMRPEVTGRLVPLRNL